MKRPNNSHLKLFAKTWIAGALNCCLRFEFSALWTAKSTSGLRSHLWGRDHIARLYLKVRVNSYQVAVVFFVCLVFNRIRGSNPFQNAVKTFF